MIYLKILACTSLNIFYPYWKQIKKAGKFLAGKKKRIHAYFWYMYLKIKITSFDGCYFYKRTLVAVEKPRISFPFTIGISVARIHHRCINLPNKRFLLFFTTFKEKLSIFLDQRLHKITLNYHDESVHVYL